jgi:hypothetical protein
VPIPVLPPPVVLLAPVPPDPDIPPLDELETPPLPFAPAAAPLREGVVAPALLPPAPD